MTPARFAALAAAYGSDIERWPIGERQAATEYRRHAPDAAALLEAEAALDATLMAWTVPGPGAALVAQITAAAQNQHSRMRRLRVWLSSLGAVATLTGGVAAGMLLVPAPSQYQEPGLSSLYGAQVFGAPLDLDQTAAEPPQ